MNEVFKEKEIGNIEVKKWIEIGKKENGIIYFFKILFCNFII